MRYLEEREQVIFTYRYEKDLHRVIKEELARRKAIGIKMIQSELVLEAFEAFAEAYAQGKIDPGFPTDFRDRMNVADKVTRKMIFPMEPKRILARLAFTIIMSQAEVLRMALEWYLRGSLNGEEIYMEKYTYERGKSFIITLVFNLYDQGINAIFSSKPMTSYQKASGL